MMKADSLTPALARDPISDFDALSGFDARSLYSQLVKYELHRRQEFGLYFTRSFVAGGARVLGIQAGSRDFEIRFTGGDLTATVLDKLGSGVFAGGWSSIYLLWGLEACRAIGAQWVRVHLQQQCWQFEASGLKKFSSSELGLLQVKRKLGLQSIARFFQTEIAELTCIRNAYRYSNQGLVLNGRLQAVELLPHQHSALARFTQGPSHFPHHAGLAILSCSDRPPGPVDLIVSCPILSSKANLPGGVSLYLAGAFQERVTEGFEDSVFEIELALEGLELDRSLDKLRRERCWEQWVCWLRTLDLQLFQILCTRQSRNPQGAVAHALLSKMLALVLEPHLDGQQAALIGLLEETPLFVCAAGQFHRLQDLQASEVTYRWLSAPGFSKKDQALCQGLDRSLLESVLVLSDAGQEILRRYHVVVQPGGRDCLNLPARRAKANSLLSRQAVLQRFHSANLVSFARMKPDAQIYRVGSLVLDCSEATISATGYCFEICELSRFEIYTYKQEGDSKVHHFALVVLESNDGELLFGDRGKEYHEWNAELDQEFRLFCRHLELFSGAAKTAGAVVCRLD
jgi:hypothetical protein